MSKTPFSGRILVLGYGSVAQCTVPLLLRHVDVDPRRVTICDFVDCRKELKPLLEQGVRFVRTRIAPDRYEQQLAEYVGPGDLIVDLAWNIETAALLEWCHAHDVRYINTSVEVWDPYEGQESKLPPERTLYTRHMQLREMIAGWGDNAGPTAILDHGANPGLVSHFTKQALHDIGERLLADRPRERRRAALRRAMGEAQYNHLAQLLGVRVIHISERDTQISKQRRQAGAEFVNTWSVEGFYEEGIAPAEMGWGTHERTLPADACEHETGPRNQICLTRFGMNTYVRSRVPSSEIAGMVIRHGEAFSISEFLTVADDEGEALYRPTVHYAYLPCDCAVASLDELREQNYEMHPSWRIMKDEIVHGYDELGVLLMGHDYRSWWTGTILDIEEARRLLPGQNATTMQVAASVLGAVQWMLRNPRAGVLLPDALPHDEILEVARPYLGKVVSIPIDWTPCGVDGRDREIDGSSDETWQFGNFLLDSIESQWSTNSGRGPKLLREFIDPLGLHA